MMAARDCAGLEHGVEGVGASGDEEKISRSGLAGQVRLFRSECVPRHGCHGGDIVPRRTQTTFGAFLALVQPGAWAQHPAVQKYTAVVVAVARVETRAFTTGWAW